MKAGGGRARFVAGNLLSIARVGLAAWFPWSPEDWRLAIVLAAALSDLFDGALSRWLRASSTFGQLLDPIADKLFVAVVLLTLLIEGQVTAWELALVAARDIAVLLGGVWVVARRGWSGLGHLPPAWTGKLATALQFAFLISVLYYRDALPALLWPTAAASGLAGLDYLRRTDRASRGRAIS